MKTALLMIFINSFLGYVAGLTMVYVVNQKNYVSNILQYLFFPDWIINLMVRYNISATFTKYSSVESPRLEAMPIMPRERDTSFMPLCIFGGLTIILIIYITIWTFIILEFWITIIFRLLFGIIAFLKILPDCLSHKENMRSCLKQSMRKKWAIAISNALNGFSYLVFVILGDLICNAMLTAIKTCYYFIDSFIRI